MVKLLVPLLADEYVLSTKTRNAHWNVTGPHFSHLHKFFQDQYSELDEQIDDLAERIRQLGVLAPATLAEFTKTTRLKEHPGREYSAQEFVHELGPGSEPLGGPGACASGGPAAACQCWMGCGSGDAAHSAGVKVFIDSAWIWARILSPSAV